MDKQNIFLTSFHITIIPLIHSMSKMLTFEQIF